MKEVRIRILYPRSITPDEVQSAIRGTNYFTHFGVLFDHSDIEAGTALHGVKNGRAIKRILESDDPKISYYDLGGDLSHILFPKHTLPIGLTPVQLHELINDDYASHLVPSIGLSQSNEGAVVSLFRFRQLDLNAANAPFRTLGFSLSSKATEIAVAHELGHLLGVEGHCEKSNCIMQANTDFDDFIERFVRTVVTLCRDCSDQISLNICRSSSY